MPAQGRAASRRRLAGALALVAAVALALPLWAGLTLRDRILAEAEREIATQADIALAATERRLQSLRFALFGLPGWIDGPALSSGLFDQEVHAALKRLEQVAQQGLGFVAIAPDGRPVATAVAARTPGLPASLIGRPNLVTLGPMTPSGLTVSAPYAAMARHVAGRPIVAISRELPAGGWVQALVQLDLGLGLLPAADLGEGSRAWLFREDGQVVSVWPPPILLPAPRMAGSEIARLGVGIFGLGGPAPSGPAETVTFAGRDLLMAWRALPEFGLFLVVERDRAAVLAPWQRGMATILAAFLLALAAAAAMAWRAAQAAAALTRSEDRAAVVANALGLLLWSRPSRFAAPTYHSDVAERLTGYSASEMTSRHGFWRDHIIHPDDRDRVAAEYATADMAKGLAQTYRIIRADGTVRWVEGRMQAVPGGGIAGVIVDITAQRETECRLARSEAELAEAMRIAGLGRWRIDPATGRFECGLSLRTALGLDAAKPLPVAENILDLILPEDRPAVEAALERVRATGEEVEFEYRLRRPDGAIRHRWARAGLERDVSAEERPTGAIVGVCQDITERREQEAQLAQASRLAALGQLTGGIAHDVNNMLTVVSLNLDLLADAIPPGTPAAEALEAARRAASGGAGLASQLLAFARRQPLKPAPVDVALLFEELRPMLARTLGRGIAVTLAAEPGLGPVRADPAQLRSALVNLAINARDAMPEGGAITITAGAGEPGFVAFAVADTGEGMPAEVAARAFEPFFTTKPAGKGTGLGLAQVYGFITQSQGRIRIDSRPGEGTVVRFTLPLAEAGAGAGASAAGPRRGARVLLVEDEAGLRSAAAAMLRACGLEVAEAENAAAAVALVEGGFAPDLLLTDVSLGPGPDGVALAALLARRLPRLRVLFATGYAADAEVPEGALFLPKPFARETLLAAVAAALERSPAEPALAAPATA